MKKTGGLLAESLSESYFELPPAEQADLLQGLAPVMGCRSEILEKDIWLCQILDTLFRLPCRKPMAFKGGTSLSKVYKAIDRFSEDIDVTIDYRSLNPEIPDLSSITSNSQRSRLSEALKAALSIHILDELVPALRSELETQLPGLSLTIEVSQDAEKIWVYYPSAVENPDPYLRPHILIEFGGRNSTLPQNTHTIVPDIAEYVPALKLPSAQVSVLSAERTFWEKATLIHVECHRPNPRLGAERLSRHWYDLAMLAGHEVGSRAIKNQDLLLDVLRVKETFYRSSFSHYAKCATGELRLVPQNPMMEALRQDYLAMKGAGMFYGDPPEFGHIVEHLQELERMINGHSSTHGL